MRMTSGLAAAVVLMAGGWTSISATSTEAASAFDAADVIRRPLLFGPSAGDLTVDVLTARDGCRFEGDDGRRAYKVWLLSRGGKPVSATPVKQFEIEPYEGGSRIRPPARPVLAPVHGALPLADGPDALVARLAPDAWTADSEVSLRCAPPAQPRPYRRPTTAETVAAVPVAAIGLVAFSPVILFGVPSENRSLVAAAGAGPAIAAQLKPGEAAPGGLEAFARENRRWVRVLSDPGSDYAIVSVDLGGKPGNGIGLPRDVAFFGVRNGVVEWRASGGMGLETSLCANAKGAFGGRKGCTNTGYYSPRI